MDPVYAQVQRARLQKLTKLQNRLSSEIKVLQDNIVKGQGEINALLDNYRETKVRIYMIEKFLKEEGEFEVFLDNVLENGE